MFSALAGPLPPAPFADGRWRWSVMSAVVVCWHFYLNFYCCSLCQKGQAWPAGIGIRFGMGHDPVVVSPLRVWILMPNILFGNHFMVFSSYFMTLDAIRDALRPLRQMFMILIIHFFPLSCFMECGKEAFLWLKCILAEVLCGCFLSFISRPL